MSITLLFRILFLLAFAAITALALLPADQAVVTTGWDKANHLLAFFTLLLLLDYAFPALKFWQQKVLLLLLYGVAIEGLQALMPSREPSLLDIAADCLGLLAYVLIRPIVLQLPFINTSTSR